MSTPYCLFWSHAIRMLWLLCLLALPSALRADVLEDVLDRGELRVGVALSEPWTMTAPDGALLGFEIDLAEQLAADLGVHAVPRILPWEALIPAVRAGEIDLIAAGLSITPARALQIEFSIPYADAGTSIILRRDVSRRTSLTALDTPDRVVAVVADSRGDEIASARFEHARILRFANAAAAREALLSDAATAYLASTMELRLLALDHPRALLLPLAEPLVMNRAAFGVRRGETAWRAWLDAWIRSREADGFLPEARGYWLEGIQWRGTAAQP